MLTMRPNFRSIMPGRKKRTVSTAANTLVSKAERQASGVASRNWPGGGPPALVTRIDTGPSADAALNSVCALVALAMSAWM